MITHSGDVPMFGPSAPHLAAFRSAIREFAKTEVEPIADEHDRLATSPLGVVRGFFERGFAQRFLPPPGGERGAFVLEASIAAEEIAYASASAAGLVMLPTFFNRLVLTHLQGQARSEYLRRVEAGPVISSFAASERAAGSDMLMLETRARRIDGGYVLDGRKEYSSNVRDAAFVIIVARTGPDGVRSTNSLSWFLVATDAPGVSIGDRWTTLGLRSMDVSPVLLDRVHVRESHRLGEEGRGLVMMGESLSQSRTCIAAVGVGIARRARDEVLAFAKRRKLYGDGLHKLQDYRFRIAEMEKDIAAARSLVWVSALRYDEGHENTKEASIAKLFAGEMVMRVTEGASLMLGSVGYTGQSVVERLFRDARHVAIVEGTAPTHKELIFASLLRRGGY